MARSRSRRDRSARPARGPQSTVRSSIGRGRQSASRRLGLLPRSLPVGLARSLVRGIAPPRLASVSALTGRPSKPVRDYRREAKRIARLLRSPLSSRQSSLCVRRERRKQVLHAKGVAGRSGRGYASMMRGARFTVSSSFTCRR